MILTSSPDSGVIALNEIQAIDPGARLRKWLAPGVGWVALEMDWDSLARRLGERPPVFCRHICPVQACVALRQDRLDLDDLAAAARSFTAHLDRSQTFSVQTRQVGVGWPYTRYDVNQRLAEELMAQGAPLDVRQPAQVFSLVLTPTQGYLGLSRAVDNLSDWAGGARRFKHEEGQVSRAEFKLLEALELFHLSLPANGLALDLGASPGGWTRILRQHAMRVVAVDPGDLHPSLVVDRAVRHVRQTAQNYLSTADERFDVILNDMRMDAQDSAHIMNVAGRNLNRDSGWALLTLKLPKRGAAKVAYLALETLRKRYTVTGARQLFHNRSEITVALGKVPW
ncbi:MAG: 50S rRNA methyltransferase [Anaerolineae bacterium]|nr:50S rRNA methyltransferase [Anaerolineae bacterium]